MESNTVLEPDALIVNKIESTFSFGVVIVHRRDPLLVVFDKEPPDTTEAVEVHN